MKKGLFITLEGPDGSGKSTIAQFIKAQLEELNYEVVHTREPGGVMIAEEIRNVILDKKNTAMDAKTEALLYAASRRQHLVEKVIPALEKGKIVLCERFVDSSLAYQGYGRNLGLEAVMQINEFAIEKHFPDLTLYLDIDVSSGLKRIASGRENLDRLDRESLVFHQRVYEGYLAVLALYKKRIKIVDATLPKERVAQICLEHILTKISTNV